MSIVSPFDGPSDFKAILSVYPNNNWIEGLFSFEQLDTLAPFRAKCEISCGSWKYGYNHAIPSALFQKMEGREAVLSRDLPRMHASKILKNDDTDINSFTPEELGLLDEIGKIQLRILIYELDHEYVNLTIQDKQGFKRYLRENGGIRVYKGGVRIFGLGGAGEDWLNLGGRRVQLPGGRLSNNQIIGAILLDASSSDVLIEQTNRRGFIENSAYKALRKAIMIVLSQIEAERNKDKARLKTILTGRPVHIPVIDEIADLRAAIMNASPQLAENLEPPLLRVERAYEEVKETLITAAGQGLSLGAVVHDVEKQVKELKKISKLDPLPVDIIRNMLNTLDTMMEGVAFLLRKSPATSESLKYVTSSALFNIQHRFRRHKISLENGFDTLPDIQVRCSRRMVANSIVNIIDNSIYWLGIKGQGEKRIYIAPTRDISHKPALIIADNGPGFSDPPEHLIRPFFTRKPDGMGLGLYIVDQAMSSQGGSLEFPALNDIELPKGINGAVFALVLPAEEK